MIDRGIKDIHTVSALLQTGRIDRTELEKRLRSMDWEPAMIVEAGRVMAEILQLVATSNE